MSLFLSPYYMHGSEVLAMCWLSITLPFIQYVSVKVYHSVQIKSTNVFYNFSAEKVQLY